jgi:UDP-N-acetylmuramoyl-tripeptide--D-alanyl-D-alanine ligase
MKNFLKKVVTNIITWEAQMALKRHAPKIIAVTGNVGKTSTKDAIYAVVSQQYNARKSQKSNNSEIGIPLTILGLDTAWSSFSGWGKNIWRGFVVAFFSKDFPEWLVLEVGADHPGDIEKVCQWLHPDIVVLTRMSEVPVHIEFFKNAEEVLREKMFLALALKKEGTLVVNSDDPHFMEAVKLLNCKKVFYGATPGADVEIVESEIAYDASPLSLPVGQYAVMRMGGAEEKIEIMGVLGNHIMYPIAAAAAVSVVLGAQSKLSSAFTNFDSPKGRMRVLKGRSSSVILDDTYNSSPLAAAAALKSLASLSVRGRKIAALADMKELGANSQQAHFEIGRMAGEIVYKLVTVGEMSKWIARGALEAGLSPTKIESYDSAEEAGKALKDFVRAGDAVLVKGSQSMRMERVSAALLGDAATAKDILVRQEEEWKTK